jgi:hypothetical protein
MTVDDPIVKRVHVLKMIIVVGTTIVIGGFVILYIIARLGHFVGALTVSNISAILSFLAFFILMMFVPFLFVSNMMKNVVHQYRVALRGGVPGHIAAKQPSLVYETVPLPITLAVRAKQWFFPSYFALCCFAFLNFFFNSAFLGIFSYKSTSLAWNVFVVLLILLSTGSLFFFAMRATRQRIEITDDGIRGTLLGQETFIRWEEARLFALCGNKSNYLDSYEIVSANSIIRWSSLTKEILLAPIVPTLPFTEYEKKMQIALAVIATKTGLPLYDLRLNWYGGIRK